MVETETFVFLDGQVVPGDQARVPVLDRGFLYGDSVYEVTRTFGGIPHRLDQHLARLERSAQGLEMALPPRAEVAAAVAAVSARVPGSASIGGTIELYLRVIVTRGGGELGLDPGLADGPRLVVIARPLRRPPAAAYTDGVSVVVSDRVRSAPALKTGNYLESVLATLEARRAGAHEALLRDAVGRVTEGGSSNVFVVRGGRVRTPPLTGDLLPGITREELLELARADGLAVDETALWPVDLERAEEMFLSSSIRGVLPVVRCDARPIGDGRPGPITRRVMDLYARANGT